MPDGAKGPSAHSFQPASSRIQWSSMRMVTPGGGGGLRFGASGPFPPPPPPPTPLFTMSPLAHVPNSSPSQVRFEESTPMS
jgi:hypothetical protein